MNPLLNIAAGAARKAGSHLYRALDRLEDLSIQTKGRNDFVSDMDVFIEKEIITEIQKWYPDHNILAEEHASIDTGHDITWIIDPIDGTTNFIKGVPHFAISIAVQEKGRLMAGLVYDPVKEEQFTAARGEGARLNERRIRVSKTPKLSDALLATGFPVRNADQLPAFMKTFEQVFPACAGVRRMGAASLDLAYVAAGRLDGYWEPGLAKWDIAAGALLVREAGGMVSDFHGMDDYLTEGNIICGTPKVFKSLLAIVNKCSK